MTKLLGVIGHPISHSLSPLIHNAWFREHGIDARYEAMQVPPGDLKYALESLQREGCKGLNITLPHKEDALRFSDEQGDIAKRLGAANTLIRTKDGGWRAENTDVPGFLFALKSANVDLAGKSVFILGAGGSARAVALSLTDLGANITVCNRTIKRAEELCALIAAPMTICSLSEGLENLAAADAVINTLSIGYSGATLDLPPGDGRLFFDISYGKAADKILHSAKSNNWKTADGLTMLAAQAAFSFQYWFGIFPDTATALERCRKAVEATQ
ncbi:MAG: shikimate dehydrogenase [Hyphomonas sp.]